MEAISKFFMKMAVKKQMNNMGLSGGDSSKGSSDEKQGGLFSGGAAKKGKNFLMEGVLMKKSKWAGRWDKRYFVLEGATLKYWEGDKQGSGPPKGHFRVNVHTNAIEDRKDKSLLILTVNDEDIVMKAKNAQECKSWVETLQKLIMKLRREDKKNGNRLGMKARHDAIRAKYGLAKKENLNSPNP